MPAFSNPVGSPGNNDTDGEEDGQPSADATDDGAENGVELANFAAVGSGEAVSCDGVDMLNDPGTDQFEYCAAVRVANPTATDAQLAGWVDFDGSGQFGNDCASTDGQIAADCERSAAEVIVGDTGLDDIGAGTCSESNANKGDTIGGPNFDDGNVPANCEGVVVVVWRYTSSDTLTTDQTFSRFRITTDTERGFFGSSTSVDDDRTSPAPWGFQADGEVEDHELTAGTLPVSISGFEARETREGLNVSWSTVSETENVGFYLWGYDGREMTLLTPDMIPSKTGDAAHPQDYSHSLTNEQRAGIDQLAITAVDNRGNEEMYGLFDIDERYGRSDASTAIPWDSIRNATEMRLASLGFRSTGETWRAGTRQVEPVAADFLVSEEGMHRITHDDLMDAGIDLRGQSLDRIAITVDGEPVARRIRSLNRGDALRRNGDSGNARSGNFTEHSVIEFWGEEPSFPNARYVDELVYRVELGRDKVRPVEQAPESSLVHTDRSYMQPLHNDEDASYRMSAVLEDPWSMAELRSWVSSQDSHSTSFQVPEHVISGQDGRLEILLAGANDPDPSPDHHVKVTVNDRIVAEEFFNGRTVQEISADLPSQLLNEDTLTVEVTLPGGTDNDVDMVLLESVTLHVPTATRADNNRILIPSYQPGRNITADGFLKSGQLAFAWNGESLVEVPTEVAGRGMIRATPPAEDGYALWISNEKALHRPEPLAAVGSNPLLDEAGDFLVIAHPAFLPADPGESHPLNDFVSERESEGWDVRLVDVTEIQTHYGGGMPVPQAVRRFLAAADQQFDYEHVLLVGDDSYDYRDVLEMGSVSFIPTFYAATDRVAHTPSDGLLADIDGDGVSDKAIGRWPVRTLDDLESIVYKTLDWEGSMEGLRNAVWVADLEDPGQRSFQAQANRMMDQLVDAGWPEGQIDSVFLDDVASPDAGRDQLFGLLEEGRAFTGFVGHGSPSMWTFDGLLVPNDLAGLDNFGLPTMISTSTCYTSYFVSPYSETVAHRWMNGYDEDAQGNPIPGAQNGAVAIHGATTLSNYRQNEFVVSRVQEYQLQGMTLGQAVLQARRDASDQGLDNQVINWGLLGDPTLTVD